MNFTDTVMVPKSSGINLPFNLFAPDMETNSQSTFEANDTRKDLIEKISLENCQLAITSPQGEDFRFLKSIHIYINAEGLPELELAGKSNIPDNQGNTLTLDATGSDFRDYIKQDKFSLRMQTVTDEVLTQDYYFSIQSRFYVDARILGQ